MLFLALSIIIVLAYLYYFIFQDKWKGLPPGPIPLPIIGNLHHVGSNPYLGYFNLYKKYGSLCRINMGNVLGRTIIVSGDPKLFKEVFDNPIFAGVPTNEAAEFLGGDRNGIIMGDGDAWQEKRRFTLRHLRDFGFGKQSMEEFIMEDVNEVLDWLRKLGGKPVEDFRRRFSLAVVNSLWRITSGERYDHDDLKLTKILDELEHITNELSKGSIGSAFILFYPKIAKLFSNLSGWKNLSTLLQNRLDLIKEIIIEHKTTLDENIIPRDLTDMFLLEIKKTSNPTSSFHIDNNPEKSLLSVLSDLFSAGSHTTSVTLSWIILYLLHYPDVQRKAYEEIRTIVGNSRYPSLKDRLSLPYCQAVLLEIIRSCSVTFSTPPHRTNSDVYLKGYFIPKGTTIIGNIYSVHHNPELWQDPETFRPERFLLQNSDGKYIGIDKSIAENILAFGIGQRRCIGESLARDSLFLFLTSIIQNFEVKVDSSKPFPGIVPAIGGFTLNPNPYTVILKERNAN